MDDLFRDRHTDLTEGQLLLRKQVLHQVETEPETFCMLDWEIGGGCRTTRCIAGWAQFLARGRCTVDDDGVSSKDVQDDAIALLGLTEAEFDPPGNNEADEQLFYLNDEDALTRLRQLCEDPA